MATIIKLEEMAYSYLAQSGEQDDDKISRYMQKDEWFNLETKASSNLRPGLQFMCIKTSCIKHEDDIS